MNKAQKITIGISLLAMLVIYFIDYDSINGLEELIMNFMPVILLGGAIFSFFSLKKR